MTRRGVYHHTHHPSVGSDDTFAISKAVIHITRRGVASVGQREAEWPAGVIGDIWAERFEGGYARPFAGAIRLQWAMPSIRRGNTFTLGDASLKPDGPPLPGPSHSE